MFDVVFGDNLALAKLLLGLGYAIECLLRLRALARSAQGRHLTGRHPRRSELGDISARLMLTIGYVLLAAHEWSRIVP